MVKTIHVCDVCGTTRTLSNGWVMATHIDNRIIFVPWNPSLEKSSKIKHLCSGSCQSKFLMRITQEWTSSEEIKPKIEEPVPGWSNQ